MEHQFPIKGDIKQATPEFAAQAAELIFSSGPTSLQAMLGINGKSPTAFIEYAFGRDSGQFSHKNHYAIVRDGQLAAIASCWENPVSAEARRANLTVLVDYYGYDCLPKLAVRSQRIAHLIPPPTEDSLGVGHIAVAPAFRQQGLAGELLDFMKRLAVERNKRALELDVALCNNNAVALYLKHDFVVQEKRLPSVEESQDGLIPHVHMRLNLKD